MAGITVVHVPPLAQAKGIRATVRRAARNSLLEIGAETQTAVRKHIRSSGRVDRGLLWNSVFAEEPRVGPTKATQATYSRPPAADYAPVVEDKRGAGKRMPPVTAIRAWLARSDKGRALVEAVSADLRTKGKKLSGPQLLDRVAFMVARSIGAKGIRGIGMFAVARRQMARRAPAIFQRHLAAEIARAG